MYSINKIQDMLNDEQILTLGQLDDVAIRGVNAIAARISLGLEMYIPPRDTHVLYPQMAVLFEDYYSRFSSKLNYYGSPPSGRILKITSKFLTTMRNKLENFNYNTQYNPVA